MVFDTVFWNIETWDIDTRDIEDSMLCLVRGHKEVQSMKRAFDKFSDPVKRVRSGMTLTVPHPTCAQLTKHAVYKAWIIKGSLSYSVCINID